MSSLFTRILLFVFLLLAGFWAGWEAFLAFLIFFAARGQLFWEHILIAFIFDAVFNLAPGVLTIISALVLFSASLWEDLLKSDSMYLKASRGFIFSFIAILVYSLLHFRLVWPGLEGAVEFSTISFAKVFFLMLSIFILSRLIENSLGFKKITQ